MSILEKLVLQGKAEQKTLSCYGAQFYALEIPSNQTIVITQIDWHPFINFPYNSGRTALRALLNYTQYQLKISDDKNSNFIHFDNGTSLKGGFLPISGNDAYDMDTDVEKWATDAIFAMAPMIIVPCFFPIQNELRLVINPCPTYYLVADTTSLTATSKEPGNPNGVKNMPQPVRIYDNSTQCCNYVPGIFPNNSPVPTPFVGNQSDGYYWATEDDNVSPASRILSVSNYPEQWRNFTQPLFTVHYTLIKENLIGIID